MKKNFSRVLSGVLAVMIAVPNLMQFAASAEEGEKFQYTMFGRNGVTMSASANLCMNGNLHTNKDAAITATNKNLNGTVTTSADIEKRVKHVYADQKIYDTYFTTNCELHEEEYVYSDMNIHINNPLFCYNNITLDGNVSLNSSLGALMNINVTGEVKNANNSVVYSKYGNITIENDSTANVNGLIYAPLGTVTINSPNVTINGIIIADQVVINGSSVNINGNDNIARFIGETSENYDFSGLEYLPEEWLGDTDADGLFDIYEKVIDSDPFNPDTDGDGLPDGYEVLTLNTDPLEIDTDENGVLDGDEDFDTDNLVNIDEYLYETLPFTPDTDEDGFVDGDEVHIYGTTPTNPDTDADKLLDGEESYDGSIYLEYGVYFDPLNLDTDGDGISDGDEVFGQTKTQEVQTQDEAITEVVVDMETNGNIDRTLTVESMQGIDAMTSNVYALVGEPFNFETESDFESATITFKIDQSKLGDTLFDNLLILWYNEEEQIFEEMPTTHDVVNSTVSTTTTHFSQYMVVDSAKWYENWNNSLSEIRKMWIGSTSYQRNLHTIILMDCSSSMASTDSFSDVLMEGYNGVTSENIEEIRNSIDSESDVDAYCVKWCDRFEICDGIINNKGGSDAAAIVTFSNEVISSSGWLYNQSSLRNALDENIGNYGGTANWRSAVNYALSMVETDTTDLYRIIIISDSNANSGTIYSDEFASNVILNVVNVGSSSFTNNIEAVAQATGGDVYYAVSADNLTTQVGGVVTVPPQFIGEDSDNDTIPDIVEKYGLKPNGELIGTNPDKKDTDGDGLEDNEELGLVIGKLESDLEIIDYVRALKPHSDPTKSDTDGDGFLDTDDPNSFISDYSLIELSNSEYIKIEYNDNNEWYGNTSCVNSALSYGSSQSWFRNSNYVDKNYGFNKINGSDIAEVGCGLIAMSDLLTYLSFNSNYDFYNYLDTLGFETTYTTTTGQSEIYHYLSYEYDSGAFNYFDYMTLIGLMSNDFKVHTDFITGVWPILSPYSFQSKFNSIFEQCNMDLHASWKMILSPNECEDTIKSMITNDVPVVFSFNSTLGDLSELALYESDDLHSYDEYTTITGHYMTVTGIIEYTPEAASITGHSKLLQVSSWGKKYYIDFETYCQALNPFTSILEIS